MILLISLLFSSANVFALPECDTVVVIAPHPDDAESSCGGLIVNAISEGNDVIILTMTGGELGIWGKGIEEARAIRTQEAIDAATVLGAKIEFFGALDASLAVDSSTTNRLKRILQKIKPVIVLAPWPLDVHADHQATGILAWRVFMDNSLSFDLYFYETSNPPHTKSFQFVPTDYVDITGTEEIKKKATYKHVSQSPQDWYGMYEDIAKVRGYEADVPIAEGYIKAHNYSGMGGRSAVAKKTLTKFKK